MYSFSFSCRFKPKFYTFFLFLVDIKPAQKLLDESSEDDITFAKLNIRDTNSVWEYFGIHEKAKEWILSFYEHRIGDLCLFARSWEIALENLSCPDSFANLDLIVARVGEPSFEQLRQFLILLDEGNAETDLIDTYLRKPVCFNDAEPQAYDFDQQKLQLEMWTLYELFKIKTKISDDKKDAVVKKLTGSCLCYLKVKTLAKVYKNILKLKDALHLTGNFVKIENLDNLVRTSTISRSI